MSTATLEMDTVGGVEDTLQYRALHTGAIPTCGASSSTRPVRLLCSRIATPGC